MIQLHEIQESISTMSASQFVNEFCSLAEYTELAKQFNEAIKAQEMELQEQGTSNAEISESSSGIPSSESFIGPMPLQLDYQWQKEPNAVVLLRICWTKK